MLQVSRATAIMLIIAYVVYVWFMGHTVSHEIFTTAPAAGTLLTRMTYSTMVSTKLCLSMTRSATTTPTGMPTKRSSRSPSV